MGVIGVGSMGYNHARVCAELPGVELVAVVDSNEAVAQGVAEKFSAKYYTDPHELLGQVDGVAVVTPTAFHYDSSKLFMENGIHVLVEKPITVAAPEARELVEIAKAKDLVLQVGHLERFNPAVVKLREMVRCPIMLEAHRLSAVTIEKVSLLLVTSVRSAIEYNFASFAPSVIFPSKIMFSGNCNFSVDSPATKNLTRGIRFASSIT